MRTSLAQGLLLAPAGPPGQRAEALLSPDVVDYLMPPQQASPEVVSQVGSWYPGWEERMGRVLRQLAQDTRQHTQPSSPRMRPLPSQALYRQHRCQVVLLSFLSDAASMISVDSSGLVALWPAAEEDITGFGWFTPTSTWQLPRSVRSFHIRWAATGRLGCAQCRLQLRGLLPGAAAGAGYATSVGTAQGAR